MIIGRPETTTTTQRFAWAQTLSIAALSSAENIIVFGGGAWPLSPGSYAQRGPPTSPKPSEYGVSPTTTTPIALGLIAAEASFEYVTSPFACALIPSRMVVPGITLVDPPCQVSVQPPA